MKRYTVLYILSVSLLFTQTTFAETSTQAPLKKPEDVASKNVKYSEPSLHEKEGRSLGEEHGRQNEQQRALKGFGEAGSEFGGAWATGAKESHFSAAKPEAPPPQPQSMYDMLMKKLEEQEEINPFRSRRSKNSRVLITQ